MLGSVEERETPPKGSTGKTILVNVSWPHCYTERCKIFFPPKALPDALEMLHGMLIHFILH